MLMNLPISNELFFELLLIVSGARNQLSKSYSERDWRESLSIAMDQSIAGVLIGALEILQRNQETLPSKELILQWIGIAQMTEQNTRRLSDASEKTVDFFRKNGFPCCVLKGVSVGRFYRFPLRRSSGDVDVWLTGGRKKIYNFARTHDTEGKLRGVTYHHIHYHLFDDVEVEVHIWPSYLSSPLRNYRLQNFCRLYEPTLESDSLSLAFNRVYILLHAYQHICGYGVGLRQIMDYYYVLKQGFSEEDRVDTVKWIKKLGMGKFCSGIMWVLQSCFGLEERYILMESNQKEGEFILNEIMLTGNMGHSETRKWGSTKTPLSRFFFNLRRDVYLAKHYPHEALWQPFFSIWFYIWRTTKGFYE